MYFTIKIKSKKYPSVIQKSVIHDLRAPKGLGNWRRPGQWPWPGSGPPVLSPPPPRPPAHQKVARPARARTAEGTALAVAGRDKICIQVGALGQEKVTLKKIKILKLQLKRVGGRSDSL